MGVCLYIYSGGRLIVMESSERIVSDDDRRTGATLAKEPHCPTITAATTTIAALLYAPNSAIPTLFGHGEGNSGDYRLVGRWRSLWPKYLANLSIDTKSHRQRQRPSHSHNTRDQVTLTSFRHQRPSHSRLRHPAPFGGAVRVFGVNAWKWNLEEEHNRSIPNHQETLHIELFSREIESEDSKHQFTHTQYNTRAEESKSETEGAILFTTKTHSV